MLLLRCASQDDDVTAHRRYTRRINCLRMPEIGITTYCIGRGLGDVVPDSIRRAIQPLTFQGARIPGEFGEEPVEHTSSPLISRRAVLIERFANPRNRK